MLCPLVNCIVKQRLGSWRPSRKLIFLGEPGTTPDNSLSPIRLCGLARSCTLHLFNKSQMMARNMFIRGSCQWKELSVGSNHMYLFLKKESVPNFFRAQSKSSHTNSTVNQYHNAVVPTVITSLENRFILNPKGHTGAISSAYHKRWSSYIANCEWYKGFCINFVFILISSHVDTTPISLYMIPPDMYQSVLSHDGRGDWWCVCGHSLVP